MTHFEIISGVETPRIGSPTINIKLEKEASDWLCKAMSYLVSSGSDSDHKLKYEQLQQEVIKAWEAFRP